MEFVVSVFGTHLNLSYQESIRTMLDIHTRGGALLALPSLADAKRAAEAITAQAVKLGFPLVCRAVKTR
jgi:ATP-dependent Clp protease adapter protein ClpS